MKLKRNFSSTLGTARDLGPVADAHGLRERARLAGGYALRTYRECDYESASSYKDADLIVTRE